MDVRFLQQLKTLLWRNALLKKRNKRHLLQELFTPVPFVGLLLTMHSFMSHSVTNPSLTFHPHDLHSPDFGQPFGNHTMIYGVPGTEKYEKWMEAVVSRLSGPPKYKMFATIEDAEDAYRQNYSDVTFGIIFDYRGDSHAYAIRTAPGIVPSPLQTFDLNEASCRGDKTAVSSSKCPVNKYLTSGFVQLQIALENVLMEDLGISSRVISSQRKYVQMMNVEEYTQDTYAPIEGSPISFVFSFCSLVNYMTVNIVAEKEKKIKDTMLMMGLDSNVFWLSWSIVYMGMMIFTSTVLVVLISVTSFYRHSSMILLFMMFVLYGASLIALAFMVTPFFNKASVAGLVTTVCTFFASGLYLLVAHTRNGMDSTIPVHFQWIMCLLSPAAFTVCIEQAVYLESVENGFGFGDSLTHGRFPLYAPMLMMLVDIFLYALLTLYFDKVIPNEYGVQYGPGFFLRPSYWCPPLPDPSNRTEIHVQDASETNDEAAVDIDIEPVPENTENVLSVKIASVSKTFENKTGETFAVDEFSLDIYEGHITCLLGHNGAGKTTLINILTGVIPPTSGTATIMGLDITIPEQMVEIRKKCGICPQRDIIFEKMSCKEHLWVYAGIKGVPVKQTDEAVLQALKDANLESQGDTFAEKLSGGQKRMLSVAIALIGDPKLIVLDEPTVGMDPNSRRQLWSLLKKKKEGRVILMTTHSMHEADILSGPDCDTDKVTSFLTSIIPDIKYERSRGKEIVFTVPISGASQFAKLFGKLDASTSSLGVTSYGVSMTTLEDVFLKLEGGDVPLADEHLTGLHQADVLEDPAAVNVRISDGLIQGTQLQMQQFTALLWIRFLTFSRSKSELLFQVITPVFLVVFALTLFEGKTPGTNPQPPSQDLNLDPYVQSTSDSLRAHLPELLVLDSLDTVNSRDIIREWEDRYSVETSVLTDGEQTKHHHAGVQLNAMKGKLVTDFVALYNRSAVHSVPAIVSLMTQSLINASGISASVNANSFPWPGERKEPHIDSTALTTGFMIGVAFVFIIPGYSTEVVRDRETKLRSKLRISGVGFNVYWGSIFVMNFALFLVPSLIMITLMLALQVPGLNTKGPLAAVGLLLLSNIPFLCFFALIASFLFYTAAHCSAYLPLLVQFAALVPYIAIALMDMMYLYGSRVPVILHYVLCVIDPPYIILGGFYFIVRINLRAQVFEDVVNDALYFDPYNHTLVAVAMPIVHMLWMYALLRVLDVTKSGGKVIRAFPCLSKWVQTPPVSNDDEIPDEDSDVQAERSWIDSLGAHEGSGQPVAHTKELRKTFVKRVEKKKCCRRDENETNVAVRNLSLGVNDGEVLGLLGPNGAGKTTVLNMIIAEMEPTCGMVFVRGEDIHTSMLNISSLGYCPQHDALWDRITLKEHIVCFATVKGVPKENIQQLMDFQISSMSLEEHKLKRANKLSGGTRRKLSNILSSLGNPSLALLDEPSAGMDLVSKRFMWNTISATFSSTKRGAILTTHCMEEADVLCDRVAIMVNGQLQCLGSTQHLKEKFCSDYILEVKLASEKDLEVDKAMDELENHLKTMFPDMQQFDRFAERAQYSIPKDNVKFLGVTFASLEKCKLSHNLEDYNFNQSSLEQVFLKFTNTQSDKNN